MGHFLGSLTPRNPSAEGSGNARSAWLNWAAEEFEAGESFQSPFTDPNWNISERSRKELAAGMREFSENVGFWVAWHATGGFDRLEDHGWNRATIYRKVKRFKESFGEHPDDYEFDWLTIDGDAARDAAIVHVMGGDDDTEDEY